VGRPFELVRQSGARIRLSASELWERWQARRCLPSDRVIDLRSGRQFPAVSLNNLHRLNGPASGWDLF